MRTKVRNFQGSHEARRIFAKEREKIQAKRPELMIDEVVHMDFIGADRYDFHPNYRPGSFHHELKMIELQHSLNFEEFCYARKSKHRKYLKYLFTWQGRT